VKYIKKNHPLGFPYVDSGCKPKTLSEELLVRVFVKPEAVKSLYSKIKIYHVKHRIVHHQKKFYFLVNKEPYEKAIDKIQKKLKKKPYLKEYSFICKRVIKKPSEKKYLKINGDPYIMQKIWDGNKGRVKILVFEEKKKDHFFVRQL